MENSKSSACTCVCVCECVCVCVRLCVCACGPWPSLFNPPSDASSGKMKNSPPLLVCVCVC